MNHQDFHDNLMNYYDLSSRDLSGISDEEALISRLVDISTQKHDIFLDNNRILDERLKPFEANPEAMSVEEENSLRDLFNSTSSMLSGTQEWMDRMVCERVSRVLLRYYIAHENWDRAARHAFFLRYFNMVRCDHVATGLRSDDYDFEEFIKEKFDYFNEDGKVFGIQYLSSLTYNKVDAAGALDRMNDFLLFVKEHGVSIDDLRDKYHCLHSTLMDTMTLTNDYVLQGGILTPQQKLKLSRAGELLSMELARDDFTHFYAWGYLRLTEVSFLLGEITIDEVLSILKDCVQIGEVRCKEDKSSYVLVYATDFLAFLWKYSTDSEDEKIRRSRYIINHVLEEYKALGVHLTDAVFMNSAAEFISTASRLLGFGQMKEYVLRMTIYSDKALFIHTAMVRRIGQVIVSEILNSNPDILSGVAGMDAAYIEEHPLELLELWKQCAMFHDIGKHFCLEYVSNASRRLTDEEFAIIKYHPTNFDYFFTKSEGPAFDCIRDCAVYHHVWHNGKGGYPFVENYDTPNRPVVDILSIADSIDAATDIIGRPYTAGKTLQSLIDEFESQSGTRYSAAIVEILKRPAVKDTIEHIIRTERKRLNFRVYTGKEIK